MSSRFMRSVCVAVAVLAMVAVAQAAWLGPNGPLAEPKVTAQDVGYGRTVVEIAVPGIQTDIVSIDGRDCTKVVLPGHVQLLDRGVPQLPYITTSLIVPGQGTSSVRVVETSYVEYETLPIVPARGSIPRNVDPATVSYEFGPAYDGGVFPADVAVVSEPYILRDHRGVNVRLYPVQWDADRGVLRVLESVTYEVVTEGSGGANQKVSGFAPIPRAFESLYGVRFANHKALERYTLPGSDGPMLVVCYDAFMSVMQPFVDWKTERGLDVEMITTSSVGGTLTGIKAAIQERYDSPEGLAFVILVGDGQQLPSYTGVFEGANDDTRYMRLDGTDVYPDALISRISAQNATDVTTQVVKFVEYERDIVGPADWTHMGTGVASNEGSPSDATRMDWLRTTLLAYNFTDVDRIYEGQGGNTAAITAALNEGRSVVNYLGHGTGTSWSSVPFNNSNVHALTNTAWPWIIDVACLNGGIAAIGESFDEAWMRAGSPAQPNGAVGVYGSSTNCAWVPPTLMQSEAVEMLCTEATNVLGVMVHAGILRVLDEYGTTGDGLRMVEQYNLFGDCSLVVRTDSPNTMTVTHQPVVPLFIPSFAVETGVPGVTVTLSGNGVVYGTGVTDATGYVDVVMENDVDTIGDAVLTVFGYNQETYQATLQVVVPADIVIDPTTVPVGETTTVTVTVTDPDTGFGMDDIMVDILGFGFTAAPIQTDNAGQVVFSVTPEFGETLAVRGQEIGATYFMFTEGLPVTGASTFGEPSVTATVASIGMTGSLTPHIVGEVAAHIRNFGYSMVLQGGGLDVSGTTEDNNLVMAVTPTELSPVTATLTKTGFQIFQQEIAVVEAFGSLSGEVSMASDGTLLADARVRVFNEGDDPNGTPLYDLTTNALGVYTVPEDLAVGYYDIYVTKFGFMPYQETYFLMFGANDHDIAIDAAPSGVLTGVVYGSDDMQPLDATVRVYRSDTGDLYTETTTDPGTGAYTTSALPFFEYRVVVRSFQHIPADVMVMIDAATVEQDFALEPTDGDILVLNDNSTMVLQAPAKYDDFGNLLAPAYETDTERAAADIVADLEDLGYAVTMEYASISDPATWEQYDMVLVSSGANTSPFGSATLRLALTTFKANGGRLMVEGGEIAYDMNYSDPTFLANVLHVTDWNGDSSGNMSVADPTHAVMSEPNVIVGPITNTYSGYGDADHVDCASNAVMAGNWTSYLSDASVICYDDNENPIAGQFVFFLFNYSAMGNGRTELLHNAVNWLLTSEVVDPTSVEGERLPSVVELSGNYPNPFNPATRIVFAIPTTQDVELRVYNVRGQQVRTLVKGSLQAGHHEATWFGRDDSGRQVASGMYFYRLTTVDESLVRKMLLVK